MERDLSPDKIVYHTNVNASNATVNDYRLYMITRAQSKRNMEDGTSAKGADPATSKNYTQPCGNTLKFVDWLQYFERQTETQIDEWKLNNKSSYLKEDAFSFYITSCLDVKSWDELKRVFNSHFIQEDVDYTETLFSLKLSRYDDLLNYFRRKVESGKKLKLMENDILSALKSGLPHNLRSSLAVAKIEGLCQWYKIVSKLIANEDTKPSQQI